MVKKIIKHHSSKADVLEEHELDDLLSKCETNKEKFVVYTLVFTELRADELAQMKPEWIKWQKGVLEVPLQQEGWQPKTTAGARTIPIKDNRLLDILRQWSYNYNLKPIKMSRVTVWRTVQKVASRVKIMKKVYPHSLRATYATSLAYKGVSPITLMHVMGWSDLKIANEYVTSSGARAKQEIDEKW